MTYQCEHCWAVIDESEVIGVPIPVNGNGYTEPLGYMYDDYMYYCPECDMCIEMEEYQP